MSEPQSFHIPPPNEHLNQTSRFIRNICVFGVSGDAISRGVLTIPMSDAGVYIDLIDTILKSESPDILLGAPLYMVIGDSSNIDFDNDDDAKHFLGFILRELQKRLD